MDVASIEAILQTYSLEDIFEYNEVTEADVLYFLVTEGFITIPTPRPL